MLPTIEYTNIFICAAPSVLNEVEHHYVNFATTGGLNIRKLQKLSFQSILDVAQADRHDYLAPLQTEVATPGRIEATTHVVSSFIYAHGHASKLAIVQVDLANAFNVFSRRIILNEIATYLPELRYWTKYCYTPETRANLWVQDEKFQCVWYVSKGTARSSLFRNGNTPHPYRYLHYDLSTKM